MSGEYLVYGAAGSGSVPVEAALTLLGERYSVVERAVWEDKAIAEQMAVVNPLKQVPVLVLPSGEVLTESAAILIFLADSHPGSGLSPAWDAPMRPRFLRWMSYISAQIYALYWIRDDLSRLAADKAHEAVIKARTTARIEACWRMMGEQVQPAGRYLLGDQLSVLDLYMTVESRWGPRRKAFYAAAPGLAEVVRRVDAEPRLAEFWAARFPFAEGWEG
jgi:GST-like protein